MEHDETYDVSFDRGCFITARRIVAECACAVEISRETPACKLGHGRKFDKHVFAKYIVIYILNSSAAIDTNSRDNRKLQMKSRTFRAR